MTKSYELYKESVGGVTMNGENMKEFFELPENVQKAWESIDNYYQNIIVSFAEQIQEEILLAMAKKEAQDEIEGKKAPSINSQGLIKLFD
mgnify:CR=1 FL=1